MLNIKIMSDPICWVCYVAITAMDQLQKEYDIEVEWLNVNAHPHFGRDGEGISQIEYRGSVEAYQLRRQSVKKVAEQYGIYLPYKEYVPSPQRALNAIYEAKAMGRGGAFKRLIMDKHHRYGEDIGSLTVIEDTARELGLDEVRILEAVKNSTHDSIIAQTTARAHEFGMKEAASGVMLIDNQHFIESPFRDINELRKLIEQYLV